jgi:heterodisulfide reductase subunit A-like polyferredoxin
MSEDAGKPATLIIGAGIAGMQAALDIAEAGYKVYLVERQPSIGGHMAQLDKTFPTLDCSSCIMTPRMVEVARHPNIELLTYSEVEMVEGEAGRFRARIRKRARSVNMEKCTSCGLCVEHCPIRNAAYVPAETLAEPLRCCPAGYPDCTKLAAGGGTSRCLPGARYPGVQNDGPGDVLQSV